MLGVVIGCMQLSDWILTEYSHYYTLELYLYLNVFIVIAHDLLPLSY